MKWKVGDKLILERKGLWGPYDVTILDIDGEDVHIQFISETGQVHENEEYSIGHLNRFGRPLTKLHKIIA